MQEHPTAARCHVRDNLEHLRYSLVDRHCAAASTLLDLAGIGQPDTFFRLQGECRQLRADIEVSKDQIAAHRSQHGC